MSDARDPRSKILDRRSWIRCLVPPHLPTLRSMRRLLLVANPSSSGFTGALHRDVVAKLSEKFEVNSVWPVNTAASRARSADAAAKGYETVVAMGGDGVVHHVANGLVHTDTSLGIVPAGTTNVVARIHGTPRDPRKAAQALLDAHPEPTSVVHITTDSDSGARSEHALFSVGVGFDADVVEAAEHWPHSKLWFGSIHFARAAAGQVFGPYRRKEPDLTVVVDGRRARAVTLFVQVHDLYTFFGRLPMRLGQESSNGPIAVTLNRLDPLRAARIVGRLVTQRDMARLGGVERWIDFARIAVHADRAAPFQADGEHLGHARSLEFTGLPDALAVLRPSSGRQ